MKVNKQVMIAFATILTFAAAGYAVDPPAGVTGGLVVYVGCTDGKATASLAGDGLIAAEGRLYMITEKGEIICFKG